MFSQSIRLRTFTGLRQFPFRTRSISITSARMSSADKSHATGQSKVPGKIQEKVPKDVEQSLPDSIHPTGKGAGDSTSKTHAKGGGEESILPKKVQEKVPESIERAVPNALHNTGDK